MSLSTPSLTHHHSDSELYFKEEEIKEETVKSESKVGKDQCVVKVNKEQTNSVVTRLFLNANSIPPSELFSKEVDTKQDSKENIHPGKTSIRARVQNRSQNASIQFQANLKQKQQFACCLVCKKKVVQSMTKNSICNLCCSLCQRSFDTTKLLVEHCVLKGGKHECLTSVRVAAVCSVCNKSARQSQCSISLRKFLVCKLCCAICGQSFGSTVGLVDHYGADCKKK